MLSDGCRGSAGIRSRKEPIALRGRSSRPIVTPTSRGRRPSLASLPASGKDQTHSLRALVEQPQDGAGGHVAFDDIPSTRAV